jgi:hypothetical protein
MLEGGLRSGGAAAPLRRRRKHLQHGVGCLGLQTRDYLQSMPKQAV